MNTSVMELAVQRLDHLKNLVIMAAADGALSEQEIALLVDRCSDLGLAEEDLEKAIDFALSGKAKLQFPIDRLEQDQMLSDLIRMMAADGKLSEVEKRLFALAAAKMGIEKNELDGLIDQLVGKHQ
ncbi:MAG: TerB family tellurite resistance protein [Pirellulaceae bacterium]